MMAHMDLDDFLYLETEKGTVIIQMFPDVAPRHVKQIKQLVNNKFYDGLTWHRVIEGFMAQTGCPKGDGSGGVSPNIPAEFSNLNHKRGTCSMARAQDPDSASCQFFICFVDNSALDGQYTVWGEVIEGMEFIDAIKKGDPANNGNMDDPDIIVSLKLATRIPVKYIPQ